MCTFQLSALSEVLIIDYLVYGPLPHLTMSMNMA